MVHHLDLWNIRHIAIRSLMGAWLFKTPVGPQAHYLNPLQFYTIRERKQSLEESCRKLKSLWNREIFYSKTSSINGWRYDLLGIPILIPFYSFIPHLFRIGIYANKRLKMIKAFWHISAAGLKGYKIILSLNLRSL